MKKYISMIAASLMLVSCLDTIILPDDKTVDEDFWQTKSDVAAMVNAAYAAFASNDVITRLLVWGDFRADELVTTTAPTNGTHDALVEIEAVNMQVTNMFATWSAFYSVINRCNIVLDRAEAVMSVDPNYESGDYQVDRSQMLALRALCYFYLVRNFRDVPYITQSYMNSSQDMQVPQSSPAYVIDQCIADLQEALQSPLAASGYTVLDWRRVGWLTDDAINAILADIYLWRASVTHSDADYEECVKYCDKVIASKRNNHVRSRNEQESNYYLSSAATLYSDLYVSQNAEESIFEIQSKSNTALCQYLYKFQNNNSQEGYLKASLIFGSAATSPKDVGPSQVFSAYDMRYYASCYRPSTSESSYDVRKMISTTPLSSKDLVSRREDYDYGGFDQNYIVYRLTDLMLMKAEAKVQLVDTAMAGITEEAEKTAKQAAISDSLRVAFNLLQAVHARALHRDNAADSMKWTDYRNFDKTRFETLVMEERLREFCFEGKRWYDLLRYNYRHINYTAAQYNQKLVEMTDGEGNSTVPKLYDDMKTLMARGHGSDAVGVANKMQTEAQLYLPVPNADIIVCPLLKQNPAYGGNVNDITKQ